MNRRNFLKSVSAVPFALLAGGCGFNHISAGTFEKPVRRRPNVVFIITDDHARHYFNNLPEGRDEKGRKRNISPNIDRLIREGTWLNQMYVSSTVCTPSRFSCHTGLYAGRATNSQFSKMTAENAGQPCVQWNTRLTTRTPNIAKVLSGEGYLTGFVGKTHGIEVPASIKVARDADPTAPKADRIFRQNQQNLVEAIKNYGFDYAASIYHGNVPKQVCRKLEHHNTDWIVKGALDFLDSAEAGDKPFFLYMATTVTHGPSPKEGMYTGNRLATPAGLLDEPLDVMPSRESIKERIRKAGLEPKSGNMTWLDDGIGALLEKLRQTGQYDNTVIFFINDHGVENGGKGSLYQGGVNTQAFVWGKGVRAQISEEIVQNVDFAPTIFDICSVPAEKRYKTDGISLVPLLTSPGGSGRESAYCEIGLARAVIKDGFKYYAYRPTPRIENMSPKERARNLRAHNASKISAGITPKVTDPNTPFGHLGLTPGGNDATQPCIAAHPHYFDRDQLYDLNKDPLELKNLANLGQYQRRLKELKKLLGEYLRGLPGTYAEYSQITSTE